MLIGLKGYKGVGKDEVGNYLVHRHGFTKHAFAGKLKEALAALFDISVDQVDDFKRDYGGSLPRVEVHIDIGGTVDYSHSWREILQRFGTEMGREVFGQDFWVDLLLPLQDNWADTELLHSDRVITDARFVNEAERIKLLGGYIVEVIRPGFGASNHLAETPLPRELIDFEIMNDDDLRTLYQRTEVLIRELRRL
jgi:hypothetical protein